MTKLIGGLIAAVLAAATLVVSSGTAAQAGCRAPDGCRATTQQSSGQSVRNRGDVAVVTTVTKVVGRKATPRGTVRLVVRGPGPEQTRRTAYFEKQPARRVNSFQFGARFKPGVYTVHARFISDGTLQDSRSKIYRLRVRDN